MYKMVTYEIFDPHVAEAMFNYVNQETEYNKFCNMNIEKDVSIAEYCMLRFSDFKRFCIEIYQFDVVIA